MKLEFISYALELKSRPGQSKITIDTLDSWIAQANNNWEIFIYNLCTQYVRDENPLIWKIASSLLMATIH